MSQQILGYNGERVILACDSQVMSWQDGAGSAPANGHPPGAAVACGSVRKMHSLGSHALICSAGLEAGVEMSLALKGRVEKDGIGDFAEIDRLAREFLGQECHRFLLQQKPWFEAHPEAPRLLYFTLAGYDRQEGRCRAFVLESKDLKLPFQEMEIGEVITMPRVLTIEAKFRRLWSDPAQSPEDLARFCRTSLEKIAACDDRVGGPFQTAAVTARGVHFYSDFI
ncbi:MAG: hypothetical protein ABSA82_03835 [Thermacetogeniaceae bacterium]